MRGGGGVAAAVVSVKRVGVVVVGSFCAESFCTENFLNDSLLVSYINALFYQPQKSEEIPMCCLSV